MAQEQIINDINQLLREMKVEALAEILNLCKVYAPPVVRPALHLVK